MSLDMFWGGAPQPINTPTGALAQLRANEFTLHEESESDHDVWNGHDKHEDPQDNETGRKSNEQTTKRRVTGGLAATAKPITVDYDSDDARIIDLKQQCYSDSYVARKLQEEGRIRYESKTVGSRWNKLRKVLGEREDDRLDDELSDWHVGEDEELNAIKEEVDKKFDLAFKKLKEKQWQEVSIYLAEKTNRRKYSAKACLERYTALIDGTALLPIELDDDQEGRRKLREERIAAAKARRVAIEQDAKDLEAARLARIEEKNQQKIDDVNRRQQEMLRKEDERRERKRQVEEKNATKIRAREASELYLERTRLQREWEMEIVRVEKTVYKQMTGKELFGKPAPRRSTGRKKQGKVTTNSESEEEDLIETGDSASDADDDEALDRADSVANFNQGKNKGQAKKRDLPVRYARTRKAAPGRQAAGSETASVDAVSIDGQGLLRIVVTRETLLNPRSILSKGELRAVLDRRDILPRWQDGETHTEVVARIAQVDESLKVEQLRGMCRDAGVSAVGRKKVLLHALATSDAQRSLAGHQLGLASTDLEFMMMYEGYQGSFKVFLDEAVQEAHDRGEDVVFDDSE